jgi:hypothetical protein
MNRKKKVTTSKKTLYVAVVKTVGVLKSRRLHDNWAAFVDTTEQGAVGLAMDAKKVWEADMSRNNGPYEIYVGVFAKKVVVSKQIYVLEAL